MADLADGGGSLASWAQLGGVGLFAGSVLLFLRDMRRELAPALKDINEVLTDVKITLAALLERDRVKSERTAASQALAAAQARAHAAAAKPSDRNFDDSDSHSKVTTATWPDEENTHPLGPLPVKHRAQTNPYGVPSAGLHGPRRPRKDS